MWNLLPVPVYDRSASSSYTCPLGPLLCTYLLDEPYQAGHGLATLHQRDHSWAHRRDSRDHLDDAIASAVKASTIKALQEPRILLPCDVTAVMLDLVQQASCGPLEPLLWHVTGDDMPRVAIVFQAAYLGHCGPPGPTSSPWRGDRAPGPSCLWCSAPDREHGHHLLRCPQLPGHLLQLRNRCPHAMIVLADLSPRVLPEGPNDSLDSQSSTTAVAPCNE